MSIPKRHHFIPRCYLEGFADRDGLLWIFDRAEHEYRRQNPINTGIQSYYYTFEGKNGRKHSKEIEELFSRIESEAKPVLLKLDNKESISSEEKEILAYFISFQIMRVPASEERFNESTRAHSEQLYRSITSSEEEIAKWVSRIEEETGRKITSTPKELYAYSQRATHCIELPREYYLEAMLQSGAELGPQLRKLEWSFSWAPRNSSFITSDNPWFNSGLGIAIIPLTATACLFMRDSADEMTFWEADQEVVQLINLISYSNSNRFSIANARSTLQNTIQRAGS